MRLAWRSLRRSPTFATTAVLTLAIGIGGSTAIFSVVNAVVWQPLPFHEPDQLVRVWESQPAEGRLHIGVSAATAGDWMTRTNVLEGIALFEVGAEPLVMGPAVQARHAAVTPNFFAVLGVQPAAGRTFALDREPGASREVILSHELWQRMFAADPTAIGREVSLEGRAGSVVVGVLPQGFSYPPGTEVWTAAPARIAGRADRDYGAVARVNGGAGPDAVQSALQTAAAASARDHAGTNAGWSVDVEPLTDSVVGEHRTGWLTLLAAVGFVMLVGCANISNLLLARGMARRTELAVRTALGASRIQIARLMLAEAVVIAIAGGIAGWVIAGTALPMLLRLADPNTPRLADAGLDVTVLAYCVVASAASAILAGLLPAVRLSRANLQLAMRTETRLQRLVVAGELAACLILLLGALLFTQTFARLNAIDLGFDPQHVISIDARMPLYRTLDPNRWQRLSSDATAALQRLRATPGVIAASATSDPPLSGNLLATDLTFPGETRTGRALYHRVSPEYFRTLGMTLVQGRDFTNDDASDLALLENPRAGTPRPGAVIVNETTARTYWPAGNALGQFLSTSYDMRVVSQREVVGIVRDIVSETRRGAPPLEVYIPYLEDPSFATTLLVRSTVPPAQIAPLLRREIQMAAPDLSLANVRALDDVVQQSMAAPMFGAVLVSVFAAAALVLAAVGVYGVCAFGVSARRREIGIRLALGATSHNIILLFLMQAAWAIGLGLVAGLAGALLLGRLVATMMFGVTATDAATFATAVALLVAVTLVATYLPVRRVLQRSPLDALR